MTTGATGQLGLALPVQGELSGTWGDTVNNGITQYTNIAIAATLTLTNDGAVTLANTTGDATASNITSSLTGAGTVTAQFAIVRVTGTLTTAKVITAPSYSKTYVVVNAATGGIVTFKASGQTGVSIAVGESAWVYYNGTDYVKIAGTAAGAAGGSNTQVQYNSSGALAGSSNLTFDGTSLTLGGNPTLSAGTANGVTYLNGSKVLTSGSALTFNGTSFGVGSSDYGNAGSINLSVGVAGTTAGGVQLWSNTTNAHSIQWGDGTTGSDTYRGAIEYAHSGDTMRFYTSSTEQMRLTSTGLGIGTSSPTHKVEASTSGNTYIGITSTTDNNAANRYKNSQRDWLVGALGGASGAWAVYDITGSAQRLTLDTSGNLGLGVTPSAWTIGKAFQVNGASVLSTGTEMYLNANAFYGASAWTYRQTDFATQYYQLNGAHVWRTAPSGTAGNAISFTQAMTLDASGNLGIGTTSPANILDVASSSGTNYAASSASLSSPAGGTNAYLTNTANGGFATLKFQSTNSSAAIGYFGFYNTSGSFTGAFVWGQRTGSTSYAEQMRLSAAGGFSVGTTADPGAGAIYATGNITAYYSDKRLKTVSGKIENALDKVGQLSGVYYTNNDTAKSFGYESDEVQVGVLAQDVETVLPQVVKAAPFDLDENGNSKSGENYKTVQYDRLVPLLIEAVKELRAEVKALKG